MYRGQIFGPKEVGLHWQRHKHGATTLPILVTTECLLQSVLRPPELIFSAIAPLPDNLSEYQLRAYLEVPACD